MKKRFMSIALCLTLAAALTAGARVSAGAASESPAAITANIIFSGSGTVITGTGAALDGSAVRITSGGIYQIYGASDAARIVVSADGGSDDVTLVLRGCDLASADSETIYFKTARSAALVLADRTENRIVSGADTGADTPDEDASGAAIRAKCPLTISGGGALAVWGHINNGIASSDALTIESSSLAVTALNNGLKSGTLLTVAGGNICVDAAGDGLQADGDLHVTGGDLRVTTGGGANEDDMKTGDSAMWGAMPPPRPSQEMTAASQEYDSGDSVSQKGLKAENAIVISAGSIALDTADDAVHAGGSVNVSGGALTIRSGDDGIHSDEALVIGGGAVAVSLCYEGLEAPSILISGGSVDIRAKDDGLNANGGVWTPPWGIPESGGTESVLRITGGELTVDSGGDGLDSNGGLYIEGGSVHVSGPSTNGDAALDSGERSTFLITGGTLAAAGYSGMMESPSFADGAQLSIYYSGRAYYPDGTAVTLADESGNVLCRYSFAHSFNCIVISSPLLEAGKTYTLTAGGDAVQLEMTETGYSSRGAGRMGSPGPGGASA